MDDASAEVRDGGNETTGFSPLDPAAGPRMEALQESSPVGWSDRVRHERGDRGFRVLNDYTAVMDLDRVKPHRRRHPEHQGDAA